MALSSRYQERERLARVQSSFRPSFLVPLGVAVAVTGQCDGAENGDQDEHRCDFKWQQQFVEEHAAESSVEVTPS